MIASDILISKSEVKSGTAAEILKGIRAGIIYVGDTRYIGRVGNIGNTMAELVVDTIEATTVVDKVDADIVPSRVSASIISSDKG